MYSKTLDLLLETLREEGPSIFALPEDADFFRKQHSSPKPKPPVLPQEPILPKPEIKLSPPPPPAPVAAPAPISEEILEPPLKMPVFTSSSIRNLLSVVAPELAIIDEIPSDLIARKIAERWKTKNQSAPISILIYQEPPEQRALLEQIAIAIDIYFGPAKIVQAEGIEKEKQWEAFLSVADLKMVIVCDYTLWQLNHLMQFYKETPAQGMRVLANTPLFLLPDLSLYLKDPLLKRSLWKALCQKLS